MKWLKISLSQFLARAEMAVAPAPPSADWEGWDPQRENREKLMPLAKAVASYAIQHPNYPGQRVRCYYDIREVVNRHYGSMLYHAIGVGQIVKVNPTVRMLLDMVTWLLCCNAATCT